jgi:hypothetical protein
MPALRGSLTYVRYFVEGEAPDDLSAFLKPIRLRAMKPLDPQEDVSERSGRCRLGEPFATDLDHGDVFFNEYVNLGFRTDRWAIPGPMLRAKLREAETAYLARKGRDRLSRRERTELKDLVSKRLRREIAPSTRVADLSWASGDGLVRFFSASPRTGALMQELFLKTFGLRLVPEAPYTLAARLGLTRAQDKAWEGLEALSLEAAASASASEGA